MTPDELIKFKIGETVFMHLLRIGVSDTLYVNQNGNVFLRGEHANQYQRIDQLKSVNEPNSAFCQRNYDLISKRMEQLSAYEMESGNFTSCGTLCEEDYELPVSNNSAEAISVKELIFPIDWSVSLYHRDESWTNCYKRWDLKNKQPPKCSNPS